MSVETALESGIDLVAVAVTIFTIGYAFMPWRESRIGWAIMSHAFGSMLLFNQEVLTAWGVIPEEYPGKDFFLLFIVAIWVIGWWLMVFALPWIRWWEWWHGWWSHRRG